MNAEIFGSLRQQMKHITIWNAAIIYKNVTSSNYFYTGILSIQIEEYVKVT